MITNHTNLLNYLIERYSLKSYLEIGINNPDNNYNRINLPYTSKVGVDPCLPLLKENLVPVESDVFFAAQHDTFDLVFVDGLHHSDQVKRDFENTIRYLNDGGYVVLHDTCPDGEEFTTVPRATKKWYGDVYKFAMTLHKYGLQYFTLDIDCGMTVICKQPIRWNGDEYINMPTHVSCEWLNYVAYKKQLLRIIDVNDIEKYLPDAQPIPVKN